MSTAYETDIVEPPLTIGTATAKTETMAETRSKTRNNVEC
jgi:hypothetical protein